MMLTAGGHRAAAGQAASDLGGGMRDGDQSAVEKKIRDLKKKPSPLNETAGDANMANGTKLQRVRLAQPDMKMGLFRISCG